MNCCPRLTRLILPAIAFLVLGGILMHANRQSSAADKPKKVLRHIVMLQFKKESSESEIAKVVDAFRALPDKIPQIADFEYGTNNSPEGLNADLTHCFLVTFASEEDRAAYLPHAAHKAFVEVLKPHMEKVLVLDYWAAK